MTHRGGGAIPHGLPSVRALTGTWSTCSRDVLPPPLSPNVIHLGGGPPGGNEALDALTERSLAPAGPKQARWIGVRVDGDSPGVILVRLW